MECCRAYERTKFCADDGGRRPICVITGAHSHRLEALLARKGQSPGALITAWNPASVFLTRREDGERQAELTRVVQDRGYEALPGEGIGEDSGWSPNRAC